MKNNDETEKEANEKSKKKFDTLKKFFDDDMQIKEALIRVAPTETDDLDKSNRIKYVDKLYKQLVDFESRLKKTFDNLLGPSSEVNETMKRNLKEIKRELNKTNYKTSIQPVYKKLFSDMNPQLVESVKQNLVGYCYTLHENSADVMSQAKSINEILHVAHAFITNNEMIMQSLPIIDEKENEKGESISWRGEKTELAQNIFNNFPLDLYVGLTDIISMPDKTLMMIRDKGHALTIEIGKGEDDKNAIRYFVPKLCNEDMIRNLLGINSITKSGANGMFKVDSEGLEETLFDFIKSVPTDADMPILKEKMEESLNGIGAFEKQRIGQVRKAREFLQEPLNIDKEENKTRDE